MLYEVRTQKEIKESILDITKKLVNLKFTEPEFEKIKNIIRQEYVALADRELLDKGMREKTKKEKQTKKQKEREKYYGKI